MRKILHFINFIATSFLGISLIDIYGFDLISWIRDTSIYKWYTELFFKTQLPIENKPSKNSIHFSERTAPNANGIQKQSETNNTINRWFNKQIIQEPEVIQEDNNKKYYIIAGLLIIACLTWYYYGEDIKPLPGIAIENFRNLRRPGNNPDNNPNINNDSWSDIWSKFKSKVTTTNDSFKENLWSYWDDFENKFKFSRNIKQEELKKQVKGKLLGKHLNKDGEEIGLYENTQPVASSSRLIDKGKEIDSSNLSNSEFDRRILNQDILSPTSSENIFKSQADAIQREIEAYLNYSNTSFPKEEIQFSLFSNITKKN